MSLLVNYTLKSAEDHAHLAEAMSNMVEGLKAAGAQGFSYSSFETPDALHFVGLLEFDDDAGKAAFVGSDAFASYQKAVAPWLTAPPTTTELTAVASTRR